MKSRRVPLPKPDPEARFQPGDFDDILEHLPETCVLIGGQAVAWWAQRYAIKTPKGDLVDAASKDIDFWGKHADIFRIADYLKRTPYLPDKREMTFLVGAIEIDAAGKKTALELLHRVPGLDTDDPDAVAVPEPVAKSRKEALVLTPVSLVLAKLYNLRHFAQKDRHDLLHLQISLNTSQAFISEVILKDPKLALWNCKRLIRAQREGPNQRLERRHGFQLLSGIPIDSIRAATQNQTIAPEGREKLQHFLEHQWPRVSGGLSDMSDD